MFRMVVPMVLAASTMTLACGPTVFEGASTLAIVGDRPRPTPPPKPPPDEHAKIVGDKIVIDEKIQFAYDSAQILSVSHGILDDVVSIMTKHPELQKVRVEGHASDEGHGAAANQYNKQLSDRRARAVLKYLVSHGIDETRLESTGYGVDKPIAPNDSDEGREKNRRVEFTILNAD